MKPVLKIIAAALMLCALVASCFYFALREEPANPSTEVSAPELRGHFLTPEGVSSAETGDMILAGDFTEAVIVSGHLLTTDKKGTLTLTRLSDQTEVPLEAPEYAYQLKVVGDDFGYLQQEGEAQFITFLDPDTKEVSVMETEHNVITWDVLGSNIAYHYYETSIIGFAKYDNRLGWSLVQEIDDNIASIGEIFSSQGEEYLWVMRNDTTHAIYSLATHADVSEQFPVMANLNESRGVVSEVVGEYWIVRTPSANAAMASQIWDESGTIVTDLTLSGYNFSGNAIQSEGEYFIPVSYTQSQTADGLLVLDGNHKSQFIEGKSVYIPEQGQNPR